MGHIDLVEKATNILQVLYLDFFQVKLFFLFCNEKLFNYLGLLQIFGYHIVSGVPPCYNIKGKTNILSVRKFSKSIACSWRVVEVLANFSYFIDDVHSSLFCLFFFLVHFIIFLLRTLALISF